MISTAPAKQPRRQYPNAVVGEHGSCHQADQAASTEPVKRVVFIVRNGVLLVSSVASAIGKFTPE